MLSTAARTVLPVLVLSLLAVAPAGARTGATSEPGAAASFLIARSLADEGHVDEALAAFDRVLATAPGDPYVLLAKADLLLHAGRVEEASAAASAARAADPDNSDALRLVGRIGLLRADRDPAGAQEAISAFERLRESQPEDLETLVSLGQLYLATGRPQQAADALAEAERLRPGHAGIQSLLARALDSTSDLDQAEHIERQRLERDPGDPGPRLELADLLARQGRHDEAVALLEAAPADQKESLDVRRRLGLQLLLAGHLDRAREVVSALVEHWPDYGGGRLLMARIEAAYGRFPEAESALSPLLTSDPLPDVVADLQVRILEGLGELDAAAARIEAERKRIAEQGDAVQADRFLLDLARLWLRHDRPQRALDPARSATASSDPEVAANGALLEAGALTDLSRYDDALAALGPADPGRPALAARRIGILLDAGRNDAAADERRALLAARPDADLVVGAVLADHARYDEAIPLLESATRRAPDSLEAAFRLAAACERDGRVSEAVDRFRGLVHRAPEFAPALNYLGFLWIDRGENLAEALDLVERAARLDPDNGAYVDSVGWGYFRLDRFPEAVTALERAARLLPGDSTVLDHLGDARLAAGDRERAAEAYREAVAAGGQGAAEAARKLARLAGGS